MLEILAQSLMIATRMQPYQEAGPISSHALRQQMIHRERRFRDQQLRRGLWVDEA
jgi:hypothetical protein